MEGNEGYHGKAWVLELSEFRVQSSERRELCDKSGEGERTKTLLSSYLFEVAQGSGS